MSLVPNVHWFDNSLNANKLRQSYLKGFLDISGGAVQLRSDNSMNFYSGESATPKFSIGPNGLTVIDDAAMAQTIDISSVIGLKGLRYNIQQFIMDSTTGNGSSHYNQVAAADINTTGNVIVGSTLIVGGNATFRQNVGVNGNLSVGGNVTIQGDEYIQKALIVGGNCTIDGTLTVKGDVSMNKFHLAGSTISANGDVSLNNNLFVNLDSSMNGKLAVGSDASFGNNVDIYGQLRCSSLVIGTSDTADADAVTFNQKFNVASDVSFQSKLVVGGDVSLNARLYVARDASLNGRLYVAAPVTLADKLSAVGDVSFNARLVLGSDASLNGKLAVASDASFGGKLATVSDASFSANMFVGGDSSLNGNLYSAQKITAPYMNATTELKVANITITNDSINSSDGNIQINPSNVGIVHIKNGLTVDGSINFTGSFIRTDTNVEFTRQIDVSNNGTGPSIIATQVGINDVALFKYGTSTAMRIVSGGNVAIGKDTATLGMLDVAGSINSDSNLTVGGSVTVTHDYTSTNGALTLTNGKLTAKTMQVTSSAAFDTTVNVSGKLTAGSFESTGAAKFDAPVSIINSSNLDMTAAGFLVQF